MSDAATRPIPTGSVSSNQLLPLYAKVITDLNGVVLEVNPTFTDVTGYTREEVIGHTLSILSSGYHPPEFFAELWNSLKEEGYWKGEIWNRRKDSSIYAEWITITALWDQNRRKSYYVGTFSDITPLRRDRLQDVSQHSQAAPTV